MTARVEVRVEGTVQGVGFRPFVYRLAHEQRLAGHVLNDERGVAIEVEGSDAAVARFLERLRAEAPPLARLDRVSTRPVAPVGARSFEILASRRGGDPDVVIAPDTATCPDCLAELLDPADRRHRYPFINCTNCGPRFTIVRGAPYDRALTTMAAFTMCDACRAEYEDPLDRRFHAQPNACPDCGPRARLVDAEGRDAASGDAVAAAAAAIAEGRIVAVKGLGGYHLACDATSADAVAALRARKRREDKPFALLVRDVAAAARLVELGAEDEALLVSPARPIVLAGRRADAGVAPAVAPLSPDLGVMLPSTPLQHLLIADAPLVMTSGNTSDEPIVYTDDAALERLRDIADLFLVADRPIETRVDDSIARVVGGRPQVLRRARGYVPSPLSLPTAAPHPLLAVGAELKSTFCVARGRRAWVSHHLGDLEHYAAYQAFERGVARFEALFEVAPEVVVHDLHPDYRSTAYALARADLEPLGVQHHHAHLAACLAEHGVERALGAIFDGTGYGDDGTVWGGELLLGDLTGYERVGALRPVRMPGGEAAVREPWRMACAWLLEAFGELPPLPRRLRGAVTGDAWETMGRVAASPAVSPVTTSMGRLFDAVAALCGIAPRVSYEGQAAIELAAAAGARPGGGYRCDPPLDPRPVIRAVHDDLAAGAAVEDVAARFHDAVADATIRACADADTVVLSGGVFQNRRLAETVSAGLPRVLMPERLPCNDGGISFGQAAIAAARLARR